MPDRPPKTDYIFCQTDTNIFSHQPTSEYIITPPSFPMFIYDNVCPLTTTILYMVYILVYIAITRTI